LIQKNFFSELRRRNVYKVAVAYAVVSWLLIQIATQVFPFFEIPNWTVRLVAPDESITAHTGDPYWDPLRHDPRFQKLLEDKWPNI